MSLNDMVCDGCDKQCTSINHLDGGKLCKSCYSFHLKDDAYQCIECGDFDAPSNWIGNPVRRRCFSCDFWEQKVQKGDRVVIDGHCYWIGPEKKGPYEFSGFGGRRFHIRFKDGSEVITHNLWSNGDIPEHYRDRLPDNAEFIQKQRWVEMAGVKYLDMEN